jgi:Flp pilus assembly pilin Flp
MRSLLRLVRDDDGQDLIEYSLGVAFVALFSAAIFVTAGSSTNGIWGQASNTLAGANSSLAAPPPDSPPPAQPPVAPADPGNGDGGGDGGHHNHGGDGHGGG